MCLFSLLPYCWIETKKRKQQVEVRVPPATSILIVDKLHVLWEGGRYLIDSPSHHSTEYNSINFNNNSKNGGIYIFPRRTIVLFHPRTTVCFCIVCPTQSYLAIVLSPSISGHVCGGVVWRWLSRYTEALKLKRETFPCCISEIDIVICICCGERIWISLGSKVKSDQWEWNRNCEREVFKCLL